MILNTFQEYEWALDRLTEEVKCYKDLRNYESATFSRPRYLDNAITKSEGIRQELEAAIHDYESRHPPETK